MQKVHNGSVDLHLLRDCLGARISCDRFRANNPEDEIVRTQSRAQRAQTRARVASAAYRHGDVYERAWPKSLVEAVSLLSSVTTISRHVSEIKCSASMSLSNPVTNAGYFYATFSAAALLPFVLSLLAYFYWIICAPMSGKLRCNQELRQSHILCFMCKHNDNHKTTVTTKTSSTHEKSTRDGWLVSTVLIVYLIQPSIVRLGFQSLECHDVCGDLWLHAASMAKCWEGTHLNFTLFFVVPMLLIYVLILPAGMFAFLWRRRAALRTDKMIFRYGLLYSGYRSDRWWWEGLVLTRKLLIIIIVTSARSNSHQVHWALLVIAMFTHLHLVERPFGGTPEWIAKRNDEDVSKLENEFASVLENYTSESSAKASAVVDPSSEWSSESSRVKHQRNQTLMPSGWGKFLSEEGHKYYVDPEGTSQWEKPPGNEEPAKKTRPVRGWEKYLTEEGQEYYVDPEGNSHWEKPPDSEEPAKETRPVRRKSIVRRTMSGIGHFAVKVKDRFHITREQSSKAMSEDAVGLHLHQVELLSLTCLFVMLWISMFFSVAECSQFAEVCLMLGGVLVSLNCAFILYCAHRVWIAFVAKNQTHINVIKMKIGSKFKKIVANKGSRIDMDSMVDNPMTLNGAKEKQSGEEITTTTIEMRETKFGKSDD